MKEKTIAGFSKANESRRPLISRLNKLYEDCGNDLVFLTNSLGEHSGYGVVPEAPYEWYNNLGIDTSSLLYLVRIKEQVGLFIINEYDDCTLEGFYRNDIEKMRSSLRYSARLIKNERQISEHEVYVGEMSGFHDCDELAVFIPYYLGIESKQFEMQRIIDLIDRLVYLEPTLTEFIIEDLKND